MKAASFIVRKPYLLSQPGVGLGSIMDRGSSGAAAPTPEPSGSDPFSGQVVLLMRFADDLIDAAGHEFAADGVIGYASDGYGSRAVSIGGETSGMGGSNVVYSVAPSLDWALQGDVCIEVAGRINTNISRPRTFIRVANGNDTLASLGADFSNAAALLAVFRDSVSSTALIWGPQYTYGDRYHLALQRIGDAIKLYVNGLPHGISSVHTYYPPSDPMSVFIGNNSRGFVDAMDGEISWVRITNAARVTGPFTVPSKP